MTSNCHLCEQAETLLSGLSNKPCLIRVEIANDEELIRTYGTQIPVLQRSDNKAELNWPFNLKDVRRFMS